MLISLTEKTPEYKKREDIPPRLEGNAFRHLHVSLYPAVKPLSRLCLASGLKALRLLGVDSSAFASLVRSEILIHAEAKIGLFIQMYALSDHTHSKKCTLNSDVR